MRTTTQLQTPTNTNALNPNCSRNTRKLKTTHIASPSTCSNWFALAIPGHNPSEPLSTPNGNLTLSQPHHLLKVRPETESRILDPSHRITLVCCPMLAPFCSSSFTISRRPFSAAIRSAVRPSCMQRDEYRPWKERYTARGVVLHHSIWSLTQPEPDVKWMSGRP